MTEPVIEIRDLQEAIDFIASKFVFDEAGYPLLAKLTSDERQHFALQHSLQHLMKQLGKIAAYLEDRDHGGEGDSDDLRRVFMKSFVSALRLAELLDVDADTLLRDVPKYV